MLESLFKEISCDLKVIREKRDVVLKESVKDKFNILISRHGLTGSEILTRLLKDNIGFEYSTTNTILDLISIHEEHINRIDSTYVQISGNSDLLDEYLAGLDSREKLTDLLVDLAKENDYNFKRIVWVIAYSITYKKKLTYSCIIEHAYQRTEDKKAIESIYNALKWCNMYSGCIDVVYKYSKESKRVS